MSNSEPSELILAKKLMDKGSFNEALQVLSDFEEKGLSLQDKVSCHLLKCQLLIWHGKYEEAIKSAEQTYKESLILGNNFQSIDALIFNADALGWLGRDEEYNNLLNQAEDLLKSFTQVLSPDYMQREASIFFQKSYLSSDIDQKQKYAEQSLVLREQLGNELEISNSLRQLAFFYNSYKSERDRALGYLDRAMSIAKENNNKYLIAMSLRGLCLHYGHHGEFDRGIMYGEQSLALFEELNNKPRISALLNAIANYYIFKGDLDRALEYLERSIALSEEIGTPLELAYPLTTMIEISIDRGDLELAQQYFRRLEQLNDQEESEFINLLYRFDKVLLLKTSPRAKNRVEAEEILREIIDEKTIFTTEALLELCDLLLVELRMTNDIEVLDEIKPILTRLLERAEKSNSYWILAESYLLQAKVALINLNTKEARRFLTQSQQIAERHGLKKLANKISKEHENLIKQVTMWEQLKESNAPISERLELAQLGEQMESMVKNKAMLARVTEEKVTVHKERKICLVCKGEIAGFIFVCECDVIYCENCVRALTDLENVCWVCNAPIDKSKPIKPYKKDEEGINLEISGAGQKEPKK